MQKESLKIALELVIDTIYNSNIHVVDKTELLLNLNHFLTNYEEETGSKVKKKVKKYE